MAQHIHTMSKHDISHLFMQQYSQPNQQNLNYKTNQPQKA